MPVSNTYIEPTADSSLNLSRSQFNDSMRAIVTNFKSLGTPGTTQFTIDGAYVGPQDGMLYRSEKTNALYIADSVHKKTSPVGGNFTRWGIGHRVEPSVSVFNTAATRATYEIGELVGVLDTGKLYLRNSNADAAASFVDVAGATQGYTLSAPYNNVTFTGQSITAINMIGTSSVSIGTTTPTQALDVRGSASISANVYLGNYVYHNGDTNAYYGFPVGTADTYVVTTAALERLRIDAAGNVSIGSTAANPYRLRVTGDAYVSTDITTPAVYTDSLNIADPAAQYNLRFAGNQINSPGYNGVVNLAFNFTGYAGGTTQFRNFIIYDGKSAAIATFTGSGKGTTLAGGLSVANGVTVGAALDVTGNITTDGAVTAAGNITAYSDARLKSDIVTIDNALDKVTKLRGVYFTKDNARSLGVIAQEVELVLPEVVQTGEYKSVAYGNIVGVLIEAIKELKTEIETLKRGN